MVEFVMTSVLIFAVMVGWLYVQELYQRFAQRNPGLGPFRGEAGCGGGCSCSKGSCTVKPKPRRARRIRVEMAAPNGRQE